MYINNYILYVTWNKALPTNGSVKSELKKKSDIILDTLAFCLILFSLFIPLCAEILSILYLQGLQEKQISVAW